MTDLERRIRQTLNARLRQSRARLQSSDTPENFSRASFLVWPPVADASEYDGLTARLQWYLPRLPFEGPVTVVVRSPSVTDSTRQQILDPEIHCSPQPKVDLRVVHKAPSQCGEILLIWKVAGMSYWRILRRYPQVYIIDPAWFGICEELEWTLFYLRFHDPIQQQWSDGISRRNLNSLVEASRDKRETLICGNGPSLGQILSHDASQSLNIICNSAVQSDTLVRHLRPAAIAIADPLYFGPSRFAADTMSAIERCMRDFGSLLIVPGGYAQFLVATNYPALKERMIGLHFTTDFCLPGPDQLTVRRSGNVMTALMAPLAAALGPRALRIWGCDGGKVQERTKIDLWSYYQGAKPMRETAVSIHPAYFRDRRMTEQYYYAYYHHHHQDLAELLDRLEAGGLTIYSSTPSDLAPIQSRYRPA